MKRKVSLNQVSLDGKNGINEVSACKSLSSFNNLEHLIQSVHNGETIYIIDVGRTSWDIEQLMKNHIK